MSNPMALDLCGQGKLLVNEMLSLEEVCDDAEMTALDEDPPSLAKFHVHDLRAELCELGRVLGEKSPAVWQGKVDALNRLCSLVYSGVHMESHMSRGNLLNWLRLYIKEPLNACISDNRSTICKSACRTVGFLCRALPPTLWRSMSDWFLSSMLHNVISSTAVVSQSSLRCLRHTLKHGAIGPKAVSVLLSKEHAGHRHPMHRLAAVQCLLAALHRIGCEKLSGPHADDVVRVVRGGLQDAMPEMRHVSRLLYHCLREGGDTCQRLADDLFETLDAPTQEHLQEAESLYASIRSETDLEYQASGTSSVRRGGRSPPRSQLAAHPCHPDAVHSALVETPTGRTRPSSGHSHHMRDSVASRPRSYTPRGAFGFTQPFVMGDDRPRRL